MAVSETQSDVRGQQSKTLLTRNPSTKQPTHDLMDYCREYAREKPEICALWCFGIGFVLGWKLKPW